jgi:hypothetical protein
LPGQVQPFEREGERGLEVVRAVGRVGQVQEGVRDHARVPRLAPQRQGFLVERRRPRVVPPVLRRAAEHGKRRVRPVGVREPPTHPEALPEQILGPPVVPLEERQGAGRLEGGRDGGGRDPVALPQSAIQPAAAFAQGTPEQPELAQRAGQPEGALAVPGLVEPRERRAQVVAVGLEAVVQSGLGFVDPGRRLPLREGEAPGRVSRPHRVLLAVFREPLQAELADRLQHRVTRFSSRSVLLAQQAVVGEGGDPVEDVRPDVANDRLDRIQGEAADEDGEPSEQGLLPGVEEVVGPGDGVAHRPLPGRQVAPAAG